MPSPQRMEVIPPDPERFREQFMARHRPVVIRGLFDANELGGLRSAGAVQTRLGHAIVSIKRNVLERYVDALDPSSVFSWAKILAKTTPTTIAEYLDEVARNPGTDLIASEQPAPDEIIDMIASADFLHAIGANRFAAGYKHGSLKHVSCLVFLANRGNASDTHTDWDGRHVINYQVFGRKKFILFPPTSGPKLAPVEIFSMVRLRGMSAHSRAAFLEYAGGIEVVLEPGDAIYMPPFYYHHVEYLEHAMGVAMRFAPPDERIVTCMFRCHRDVWVQNVWTRIIRDPDSDESQEAIAAFERAISAGYRNRLEKYRTILGLAKQYCERWEVFGEDHSLEWLSSTEFLEHVLSVRYVLRKVSASASRKESLWHTKERARIAVEMFGRRVLSLIQQL